MDKQYFSKPLSLRDIQITDDFWQKETELVRTQVLPYQWAALNDRVAGAAPSYCMRNFALAGKQNQERAAKGVHFTEPKYRDRGFEALPSDPQNPKEEFYGFVFQDSDFSKWIEAVGYSLAQHPDAELEQIADEAIDIVCAAQQADGYLDTYYILNGKDKIFSNLKDHHELYCFGHLVEGAIAYYEATGKDKFLQAARRFADYIEQYFGAQDGKCKGYPGHEIAEMALARLYEVTGEQKYLDLSKFFLDARGTRPYYFDTERDKPVKKGTEQDLRYQYYQAHLPVREQDEAVGHAVRAVYLYSGMADVARLTEDESLFTACEKLWNSIVNEKMYITGGIGATHIGEAFSYPYDLPNDTAYAETCASIGLVFFARRMLEIYPNAKYADVMERALYNGILSGMALDGRSFFYVNPLEANPEACRKDERKAHIKAVRRKWFGCACCPPNLARLLSSVGAYAYTETEDTLFVHLYVGGELKKTVHGKTAKIHLQSNFPWDGTVRISVQANGCPLKLALRIPDWCETYTASGLQNAKTKLENGYLYVEKSWKAEETVTLSFPMDVRLMAANPKVRETVGKVAVTRGPLVYCMEEVDNDKNLHLLSVQLDGEIAVQDAKICDTPAKIVEISGFRRAIGQENALYMPVQAEMRTAVKLKFIPYYMWANRAENEMQVWTRAELK